MSTGALTFVFTDIEGSTQLWERAPTAMKSALERHDVIVRTAIDEHGGRVFATGGDGVAAVFARAADAVQAAVEIQRELGVEPWPAATPVRVRVGVHSGEVDERDGDYFGTTLNRTARLMAVAHGGQAVCSGTTAALLDGSEVPLVDLGQHRLRDLSAAIAVFQIGDGDFPPLRSLDSVPSNLPTLLTDLIGRTDDVRALVDEVRSNRLVTLTGVGGVGKTRLALAVGGAVAPDFVDGCWLVELAPVGDGTDVVRTIAAALGASSVAVGDVSALLRYLEHRRLVLVLDNCEHVLDAAADAVDQIVAGASDVHIITTSREPLGVDGEVVRRIRSLDDDPSLALFVERASAADGDFRLTDANAADVAEICSHLDGIPLAIELAAARVRTMAPAEIARRLDDRFRVLTGGRRAQERHRTLQATVGWSYDLLRPDEQRVFACLSVFPAAFDLTAAAAVAGGPDDADVVDAVLRLVDRSLVVHDGAAARYRLLETLRQYGADRLAEQGDVDAVRRRYAAHFVDVVARYGPATADGRHDEAMAAFVAEIDNVRATAEWLFREGEWRMLRQLLLDARPFFSSATPAEVAGWIDAALDHDEGDMATQVDLAGVAAMIAANEQAFDVSARRARESIELAAAHGLPESPWARFALAQMTAQSQATAEDGIRNADATVALAERRGDEFAAACGLAIGAVALAQAGRVDAAQERSDLAIRRAERLGNALALAVVLTSTVAAQLSVPPPIDLDRVRALIDARADDAVRPDGGVPSAWLLLFRAAAVADVDPGRATGYAVDAVRFADRAGSPLTLLCALDALAVACARGGLADEAHALAGYIELHADDIVETRVTGVLQTLRREAIAALAPPPSTAPPPTRRELLSLVQRVEQAVAS